MKVDPEAVCQMRRDGWTKRGIAREFSVTDDWVGKLLARHCPGLPPPVKPDDLVGNETGGWDWRRNGHIHRRRMEEHARQR